jgi:hypothetical protein
MNKLVDGSESITEQDFNKEKLLCLELASKLEGNSQLGVIQFGGKAQITTPLTANKEEWEKIDGMGTQLKFKGNIIII